MLSTTQVRYYYLGYCTAAWSISMHTKVVRITQLQQLAQLQITNRFSLVRARASGR
eukprot:SAG11_NODE_10628_length_816_cov_0.783821_1_plen_55_part_10